MGSVSYPHPRFALNERNDKICTADVSPDTVLAVSWWSKDFTCLLDLWPSRRAVLERYKHHFSFTINGEAHTVLEPGLRTPLEGRLAQLRHLTAICREQLHQDADASIMVHLDPICVYSTGQSLKDNLAHVPRLCAVMKELGLTRLHVSFAQFAWANVKSRLRGFGDHLKLQDPSVEERVRIFTEKVLPHTRAAGVSVQTCTAEALVEAGIAAFGACVGVRDIRSITGQPELEERHNAWNASAGKTLRHCQCYEFRDVGDKRRLCEHGCRYCFANPKLYDF